MYTLSTICTFKVPKWILRYKHVPFEKVTAPSDSFCTFISESVSYYCIASDDLEYSAQVIQLLYISTSKD